MEQDLRVATVQVRACEEVGADHLQTIAAGFVCAEHHSCRFNRLNVAAQALKRQGLVKSVYAIALTSTRN